eukprot:SAG31_NODE_394_length_16282_cov_132.890564_3_plen_96_part_00
MLARRKNIRDENRQSCLVAGCSANYAFQTSRREVNYGREGERTFVAKEAAAISPFYPYLAVAADCHFELALKLVQLSEHDISMTKQTSKRESALA